MQDRRILCVQIRKHLAELLQPQEHRLLRELVLIVQIVLQVIARDIIHHRIDPAASLQEIIDLRKIGVAETLQDIRLPPHIDPPCVVFLDPLDHDLLAEPEMPAEIDHSRAAFSDLPDDLIHTVDDVAVLKHILPPVMQFQKIRMIRTRRKPPVKNQAA